jgi:CubicO group peptidase (beta-lactamase class C family)
MTKPVTSAAIMMLVESGKLKLDDPAAQYVPAIGAMNVATDVKPDGSYSTRAPKRAITVRDLLTHTSGIGYSFTDPLLYKLETSGKPEAEFPLIHDPGEKWSYGAGTRHLGTIVEKVSGQPLDQFLRVRIFEPLGMNDTSYEVASSARPRTVTVHQRANGALTEEPNPEVIRTTPVRGDGGLFSTAQDYGKFVRMFLNGGRAKSTRILTEASIRDMTRNQIGRLVVPEQPAANALRTRPFPLGAGRDTWGLGFQLASKPSAPTARSAGSYSWAGINNTHFWVDPVRQVGVVVLMQVLPFYDEACIKLLTDVEQLVNSNLQ